MKQDCLQQITQLLHHCHSLRLHQERVLSERLRLLEQRAVLLEERKSILHQAQTCGQMFAYSQRWFPPKPQE